MVDIAEPRERGGRGRYASDNYALDRVKDELGGISKDVAVLATKLEGLTNTVGEGFKQVNATFAEINSKYATATELATVKKDLEDVRKDLKKGVWIVLAAIIVAILGVVFKAGLLHG